MPLLITNNCTYSNRPESAQKLSRAYRLIWLNASRMSTPRRFNSTCTSGRPFTRIVTSYRFACSPPDGDAVGAGRRGRHLVLVDHLQPVVVDVGLVEQVDVLERPVVALQHLDVVGLDLRGLLDDPLIRASDLLGEEPLPLPVGERDLVQRLQLDAQVRHQLGLGVQRQVVVRLLLQQGDERLLQVGLGLVAVLLGRVRGELGHHRRLGTQRDRLIRHRRTRGPSHDTASSKVSRRSR